MGVRDGKGNQVGEFQQLLWKISFKSVNEVGRPAT